MEPEGPLFEGVLPDLLRQLYVGRRTGTLVLSRDAERRGVRFYVGNIVNAETNVREDRMGDLLVQKGRLTQADLMLATGRVHREGKRLGEVLIGMGLLDRDGLRELVAVHVDVVLSRVFAWNEGQYSFREEFGRALDAEELTLPYSTGDLILRASRSVRDPDIVRYRLGDLGRPVALARDPLLRFQRLSLSAEDGCVLGRVDGRTSARDLVRDAGLAPDEVRTSLYALLNTGIIELLGAPVRQGAGPRAQQAASAEAPGAGPGGPPTATATVDMPLILSREQARNDDATAPLARPDIPLDSDIVAPGPASADQPPAPAVDARRAEILETHSSLATRNHFELLGLTPEADDNELREAYFRLSKRFHPDAHHEPGLVDLREKLEAVFVRLGEVYETLRSPRLRARYARELRPATAEGSEAQPPDEHETPEDTIARAAECIVRERYWEALPLLERAIPRVSGGVKQRGRILLARIYARDPDWVAQAEELLQSVLEDEPGNTDVHFYLGLIYEHQGHVDRALAAFRKVLELEPQSADARARVAELTQSQPALGSPER
jgi:tetratricopeptide (TPR) repeat protein